MPLRVGLVAATLVLVAFGLLASGIAVTSILRHSLTNRVDETLLDASRSWAQAPRRMPTPPMEGPNPARPPSDFYVRGIDADGRIWMAVNDRAAEPALPADNDVGPEPVTVGSIDNSHVQWRAMSVHGPARRADHRGHRPVRRSVDGPCADLVAGRHRRGGAAGARRRRLLRSCIAACGRWPKSSRPPRRSPPDSSIVVSRNVIRAPRSADCRWRSTECSRRSSAPSRRRSRRPSRPARSEERMRRFITDASHELRTPLTTIRGFAELYRQGAARDVEMLMSRIESESRRMGLLVEDLLLLARLDAQRPLERHRVDLLALASDAVHDAQSIAPKRTITMEVFDGPGTPEVLGDEARLRQVLGNLVANALQHTPESAGVTVRVGTDDDNAVLEVVDEGPGMSARGRPPRLRAVLPHRLVPRRAPAAAPGSGCRSSTRWSTRTAARSASPPRPGRAAGSRSSCRGSPTCAAMSNRPGPRGVKPVRPARP